MWSYQEALVWLYGRQALGIKLGLGKVERLLASVGDPHRSFRSVHVAGTNGKGSVTRMLARILLEAGLRTGATTSPHLVAFPERIEVDGSPITRDEVAAGLADLRPGVAILDAEDQPPTFFEVVTALAFLHFARAGVSWAVVETGLGGRLDATNVLAPELAIITNVTLDHERLLGDTVGKIASEKAGIMKPRIPLVTAAQGEALAVLTARSHAVQAPMSIVRAATAASDPGERPGFAPAPDYVFLARPGPLVLLRPTGESHYQLALAGAHQHENAAVVVAAVEALRARGVVIPEGAVRLGLQRVRHPGRLQEFVVDAAALAPGQASRPITVLVDGAHNPAAAQAVRVELYERGWRGHHLVAGFCADKAWRPILDTWLAPCAAAWAVPVRNPRTLRPAEVAACAREAGVRAHVADDVRAAFRGAVEAGADRILVAGSLFLAGEAVAVLTGESLEEIHGTQ